MFHMIKDKVNLLDEYDKLKMKCYICHQEGHYAKYCFRVHYVPDRDMILNAHFKENLKFQTEYKRFKRTRFHALTGRKLMMTRLRDLIIDHPDEMRKHVQSDLFKSNSFVPPHLQNKNFLEMPRVVGARRRSRTLTGAGIPEHLLEAITPSSQDNSAERMAFVSQQKNKIITKLKTLKTARPDGQQSSDEESGNTEEKEQKEFKEYKASEKSIPSMGKIVLPSPDSAKNFTFEAASSNADEVNIYKPTLQRTSTIRHLLDHTYEDFVMDMVTNYQVYFPHNNSKKIIDSINLPHRRRRPTNMGSGVIPKKKLGEMFNRSNSAHAKKLHKMNSSASPEKRGKSLFVGNSRFSIWNAAKNTLKRKPTGANNQPNISPIGLAASKHSALAGLIPHALAMTSGKNKTTGKPNPRRRQSRSLGNLDSPYLPKLNAAEISQEMSGDLRLAEKNSEAASESRDFSPKKLKPSPLGQFMRRGMSLAPAFIRRGRQDTWGNNSSFNSEV